MDSNGLQTLIKLQQYSIYFHPSIGNPITRQKSIGIVCMNLFKLNVQFAAASTPARTLKWTIISSLENIIFELKNGGKKWSRIYFEIHRAPLVIPAKLPGQLGNSEQIFLHWAGATLKGLSEFQYKKARPLFPSFLSKKW